MPSDGNRSRSQSELERMLQQVIVRQKELEKDVERLETLEFTHWDDGRGCVSFYDFADVAAVGTARVDVDPELAENGDFVGAQAVMFWVGATDADADMTNLFMRINNQAGANYYYASKYVKGGAVIVGPSLGAQNEMFIGRIGGTQIDPPGGGHSAGHIIVTFYSANWQDHHAFGDWSGYETLSAANARQEKGEFSGSLIGVGALSINRFDFFPAAGNFTNFRIYLYIWCPQLTPGFIPDD